MRAIVFGDPAVRDFIDRDGIEVVQLLASAPDSDDKIPSLQKPEMLGHSLPRHVHALAKFAERLSILFVESIQELPAAGVRERLEHSVVFGIHGFIMQPFGCMSNGI